MIISYVIVTLHVFLACPCPSPLSLYRKSLMQYFEQQAFIPSLLDRFLKLKSLEEDTEHRYFGISAINNLVFLNRSLMLRNANETDTPQSRDAPSRFR